MSDTVPRSGHPAAEMPGGPGAAAQRADPDSVTTAHAGRPARAGGSGPEGFGSPERHGSVEGAAAPDAAGEPALVSAAAGPVAGGTEPDGTGGAGPDGPGGAEPDGADYETGGSAGVLLSGRYRLEQRIAAGGMGEVWRATDEVLGRPVAVKLLRHAYVGDEALASRFRAEARYAAALSHPGIAQVFDYGEQQGPAGGSGPATGAFLVMELVPGEPLSALLARAGRLSAKATLDIVAQAANALQAAHAAGIVHRDIKPGNLIITADGRVKITDFGIARAAQAAQAGHLTQTGMVMGTAQYVSPEQASGLRVTHTSDIYSLGVVAYECLAGKPPFSADALIAIALAHVRDVPPPLPEDVPPLVSEMVMRMLAKRPEDRPATARAVTHRATMLRDALWAASEPALADLAADDAGAWFAEPASLPPRPHDGATTQLPVDDPGRPPRARRTNARRRAMIAALMTVAVLAVGGVTTALMVNGHHAADVGSRTRPSQSASHRTSGPPTATPSSSTPTAPAIVSVPPSTTPPASPTESVTPTPTVSASHTPSVTPSDTATSTPTSPPPTTPTSTSSPGSPVGSP